MHVDIQLNPARRDWPALRDEALAAEAAGYGALWVFDHLAGQALGGDRMLECFTLLGAVAAVTSRIALGSLVVNMTLREPAAVVVGAASVQLVSDRPFFLGLGAGAGPTSRWAGELRDAGVAPPARMADRHARVERTLELCERMWRADRDADLATFPRPDPVPQTIIGVNSERLAAIAGRRADGINVWWRHPDRDAIFAACDRARPAGRPFVRTTWVRFADELLDPEHPERRQMAAVGIDRLIMTTGLP
jgi:alkanesulfonate monooxygenase SsuD/methylene tetrahydromethanopterin reductase-like flavin-dependent oxidoreductase (luciferase family)